MELSIEAACRYFSLIIIPISSFPNITFISIKLVICPIKCLHRFANSNRSERLLHIPFCYSDMVLLESEVYYSELSLFYNPFTTYKGPINRVLSAFDNCLSLFKNSTNERHIKKKGNLERKVNLFAFIKSWGGNWVEKRSRCSSPKIYKHSHAVSIKRPLQLIDSYGQRWLKDNVDMFFSY